MPISSFLKNTILSVTGAEQITDINLIQGGWAGYGQLLRVRLTGGNINSVVIKLVNKPQPNSHPKGWNTKRSHLRKLHSYRVEFNWYQHYGNRHHKQFLKENCYLPRCLMAVNDEQQRFLILEDLSASGYPLVKTQVSLDEVKTCITWLANFHVLHLQNKALGLWQTGTYWQLATRPDELAALLDLRLKNAAQQLDQILRQCPYQTLVHGDAKLENFCFSDDGKKVAAVDFQYTGLGCGMKDLILFISSCIPPDQCEELQSTLLDHYFQALTASVTSYRPDIDAKQLEQTWRPLYAIAWADFQRFVKGWSPTHWKINTYTEQLTTEALNSLCLGEQ